MSGLHGYVRLSDNFFPKRLENFFLLDKRNDDLYELTEDAFKFILRCDGTRLIDDIPAEKRFVRGLLNQDIITLTGKRKARSFLISQPPVPTLRYLEIQLTERCNIRCRHCYQGDKGTRELNLDVLIKCLDEFVKLQGLRVILSGGEPLLYSKFFKLNDYLKGYPARVVLLSNGTRIPGIDVKGLNIDEIQFSLDGMEHGHDFVRGTGCFKKLVEAVKKIRTETKIDISFATMVHKENIREFPRMKKFIKETGGREWGIDYPVFTGYLKKNKDMCADAGDAVRVMRHRFGASYHSAGDDGDYACGLHLMTLAPDGKFLPCGFYPKRIYGTIEDGLTDALKKRRLLKLSDIKECVGCPSLTDCRGGCRFRAGGAGRKDPFMCAVYKKF